MNNLLFIVLMTVGVLFNIFGCIGLMRLPDVYNRLQASTKCVTLGTCSILLSLVFKFGFTEIGVKGLLAIPLLFFASTVAAHALIKGAHTFGVKLGDRSIIDEYEKEKLNKLKNPFN